MKKIKAISWNIWQGLHFDEVKKFLKDIDADVIAIQESSHDERGNLAEILAGYLGYQYFDSPTSQLPKKYLPIYHKDDEGFVAFGSAILSRYPIIKSESIKFIEEGRKTFVKAHIDIGGEIIEFVSLHLNHTHQKPDSIQDKQLTKLIESVALEKSVIMGDFNAVPESNVIKEVGKFLINAEKGEQTPTWSVYKDGCSHCQIGEIKYKLDYIFTSPDIKASEFCVHRSKGSDHLPVSVLIEV